MFHVLGRGFGVCVWVEEVSILYDWELECDETVTWAVVCLVWRIILLIKSNCSRVKPSSSRPPLLLSVKVIVAPVELVDVDEILLPDDIEDVLELGDNILILLLFKGTFIIFTWSSSRRFRVLTLSGCNADAQFPTPLVRYEFKQVAPSGEFASPSSKYNHVQWRVYEHFLKKNFNKSK